MLGSCSKAMWRSNRERKGKHIHTSLYALTIWSGQGDFEKEHAETKKFDASTALMYIDGGEKLSLPIIDEKSTQYHLAFVTASCGCWTSASGSPAELT